MPSASAPWVLPFAGWSWPCGPERVEVRVRPRAGVRCHLSGQGNPQDHPWRLWVDPTLPAPTLDEGPLGCEARLLRVAPPPRAVDVQSRGPRAPLPGADAARGVALRAALRASFPDWSPAAQGTESPEEAAARSGLPASPGASGPGGPADPAAAQAAAGLLEARLLLYEDLVSRLREEPRAPDEPPAPLERLGAWLEAAHGRGLGAPTRSPRACQLEAALCQAGLVARWPLGAGLVLVLCAPGARAGLGEALAAHGLRVLPFVLTGVAGLRAEPDPSQEEVVA